MGLTLKKIKPEKTTGPFTNEVSRDQGEKGVSDYQSEFPVARSGNAYEERGEKLKRKPALEEGDSWIRRSREKAMRRKAFPF